MPNLAPDLREYDLNESKTKILPLITPTPVPTSKDENDAESFQPKKKKYAKEAWPGKRPAASMLLTKK